MYYVVSHLFRCYVCFFLLFFAENIDKLQLTFCYLLRCLCCFLLMCATVAASCFDGRNDVFGPWLKTEDVVK